MFGLMGLTLGLSVLLTGSTSTAIIPTDATKLLLGQFIGGMFAVTIFWWALFVVAFFYLLHISPIGNWIFALGGDKVSARNAGIPTERLTISLFMLSGFCAAFVGMSQAIVYQSAQVATGQSFIFNSIMCVVIGGVLLTGGFGSVVGHRPRHDHLLDRQPGHLLHELRPEPGERDHRRAAPARRDDERHVPAAGAFLLQRRRSEGGQ